MQKYYGLQGAEWKYEKALRVSDFNYFNTRGTNWVVIGYYGDGFDYFSSYTYIMPSGGIEISEQEYIEVNMTYANETLRNEYMSKAQDIGSGAITLVNDFFSNGIADIIEKPTGDFICVGIYEWTLTDLDRALDEMGRVK